MCQIEAAHRSQRSATHSHMTDCHKTGRKARTRFAGKGRREQNQLFITDDTRHSEDMSSSCLLRAETRTSPPTMYTRLPEHQVSLALCLVSYVSCVKLAIPPTAPSIAPTWSVLTRTISLYPLMDIHNCRGDCWPDFLKSGKRSQRPSSG